MRSWLRLLIVLLVFALAAGACGNSDDDDTSAGDGGDTTEAPSDTEAPDTTEAPSDTEAPDTTEAPSDTEAPAEDGEAADDGEAPADDGERDTFVALEGVPGVSDDAINFAAIATKANNPLGTCILDCYVDGIEAYFAYRNDEGGIFGRELTLDTVLDDELSKNLERSQEVISGDGAFGVFGATLVAAGWGALDDAAVPTYVWNIHATEVAGRDAIFGHMAPACADCSARFIPWLVQETGASRPAFLGYGVSENSKVCAETYAASVEMYADEIGLDEVAYLNSDLAFGLPNGVGPEVTAMKDAGVDFIATCMDLNGMKTLGQELQRQGMDDVVMYHPNSYNQDFVAENADLFEGDWVLPQFVPFEYDTGLEAQQEFLAWMDATGSELSELAMIGWINADQAFKALLAAGPEFDRQAVIDAANEMTEFSAGGLINPIDWTRQHNPPTEGDPANDYAQECVAVVRIEGGVFVPVTEDETKPWLCWSNENLDYGEPVETSFGATD